MQHRVALLLLVTSFSGPARATAPTRPQPLRILAQARSVPRPEPFADGKTGGDSRPYDRHIRRAESRFGVAGNLLRAVIRVESNFDPRATSSAGAKGLMQLMPMTARAYGVRNAFDPAENIQGGARYLSELARSFRGDIVLTLAAYHAGPTNVMTRGGALSSPVTRAYVTRVLSEYAQLTASRRK